MSRILVLGKGQLGRTLVRDIEVGAEHQVFWTSRSSSDGILFNFEEESHWNALPKVDFTVWTFPVTDLGKLKLFLQQKQSRLGMIIIIGSTGQIVVSKDKQVVHEESPRNLDIPRAQCENFIQKNGGILLSSSGIYGNQRNPLDWLNRGLIKNYQKILNVIHVEDLSHFVLQAIQFGEPGRHYIASDGQPQSWKAIIERSLSEGWLSQVPEDLKVEALSKVVDNSRSLKELQVDLKYLDIYKGLEKIMNKG